MGLRDIVDLFAVKIVIVRVIKNMEWRVCGVSESIVEIILEL